nr:MAG TPA: tail tube protein [Caudoviricetes sp.]
MAKIGLTNIWWGKLTEAEDGAPSYDGAKSFGKAVSCKVSVTNNDATLYAEDTLAESDKSFNSASVTLGVADDDDTIFAPILGHTVSDAGKGATGGEMVRNANDVAPYIGLGRVITKMVNGALKYKGEFLYKVKFSEPSQDDQTKGEKVDFKTPEIEGSAAQLMNGDWSAAKTFDTKDAAVAWVKDKLKAATE